MKKIFALLLLQASIIFSNPFLQAPKPVTVQDLVHIMERNAQLDFTWYISGVVFNCICHNNKAGFSLTTITEPVMCKEHFQRMTQNNTSFFGYTYGETKKELCLPRTNSEFNIDYHIAAPRICKNTSNSKALSIKQLAEFITKHSVIFYTGAGLSIASGLPSMVQLEKDLHIETDNNNELNLQKIIAHSSEILESIKKFSAATTQTEPSAGHYAIATLAQKKQCALFTENIDILHEKSGIESMMVSMELQKDSHYFKDIDAIICIGLSYDDRGFLGLYKEQNSTGIIIAIDLKQPSYVGEEDYLVIGDAQAILPTLAKMIIEYIKQ